MADLFRFVSLRGPAVLTASVADLVVPVAPTDTAAPVGGSASLRRAVTALGRSSWRVGADELVRLVAGALDLDPAADDLDATLRERLAQERALAEAVVVAVARGDAGAPYDAADSAVHQVLLAELVARVPRLRTEVGDDEASQAEAVHDFMTRAVLRLGGLTTKGSPLEVTPGPRTHRVRSALPRVGRDPLEVRTELDRARLARRWVGSTVAAGMDDVVTTWPSEVVDGLRDAGALREEAGGVLRRLPVEQSLALLSRRVLAVAEELEGLGVPVDGTPMLERLGPVVADPDDGAGGDEPPPLRFGVGDLLLAEVARTTYEYGDIAHVENVLAGERRRRTFTRTHTTEEELVTTEESESTTETDTSSTSRFELEQSSESSLSETLSWNAGASVSGGFGPVTAQASFGIDSATARESSQQRSTSFAQEVVATAVSKVRLESSTRRRRATRVVVEDATLHAFVNTAPDAEHVTGIYRWVDKIEHLRLVDYGQRLMLRLVVPEPGALLRWSGSRRSARTDRPPPPMVVREGMGAPLRATDLTEDNYLAFAAAYGAVDVEPPPLRYVTRSLVLEPPATGADAPTDDTDPPPAPRVRLFARADATLEVPPGYRAIHARGVLVADDGGDPRTTVSVGGVVLQLQPSTVMPSGLVTTTFNQSLARHPLTASSPDATAGGAKVPVIVGSLVRSDYAFALELVLEVTEGGMAAWQAQTWASIDQAYRAMASAWEEQQLREELTGVGAGSSPATKRQVERAELTRLVTEILAGAPGSIDATDDEADQPPKVRRGRLAPLDRQIAAYATAFEWEHAQWECLDYFWAPQSQWEALRAVTDDDPDHRAFLAAGAAIVTVPVRPGHATSTLFRLWTGRDWPGDRPPLPDDDLAVALGAEVATGSRGAPPRGVPVPGSEWQERLPTDLVAIQPSDRIDWDPAADPA